MAQKIRAKEFARPGYFFPVHTEWFESPAFRSLSLAARCLLAEFLNIYRPSRNGHLVLPVEQACKRLKISEGTASRAFNDLMEKGFLVLSEDADHLNGRAREFRITILPTNNSREPTDDWRRWSPDKPLVHLRNSRRQK